MRASTLRDESPLKKNKNTSSQFSNWKRERVQLENHVSIFEETVGGGRKWLVHGCGWVGSREIWWEWKEEGRQNTITRDRGMLLSSNQAYTGVLWKTKKKKVGLILVLVSVQNSIPENFVRWDFDGLISRINTCVLLIGFKRITKDMVVSLCVCQMSSFLFIIINVVWFFACVFFLLQEMSLRACAWPKKKK